STRSSRAPTPRRARRSPRRLLDDLDAELLDAVPQRALRDAEQLGGLDLDALGLLQRIEDEAALDALELLVERGRDARGVEPLLALAEQVARQVGDVDRRRLGDDDRALDAVLQLADVARPVVLAHRLDRRRAEAADALADVGADLLDEVLDQRRDV